MNTSKLLLLFVLMVAIQTSTFGQEWTSHLSQAKINDLLDTGTELHLATDAGLVVVNKSSLEISVFDKSNSNLPTNHIQSITKGPNGDSWIGTYDLKMAQFDGTDFQNIETPEGIANPNVAVLYDMEIGPNGDVWIGAGEGIFHKQGNAWSKYDQNNLDEDLFAVWDLAIDTNGDVFAASNHVYQYSNGVWSNITEGSGIMAYVDAELYFSENGDLFFSGDLDQIGRYDGTNWEGALRPDLGQGVLFTPITSFAEDENGKVYANFTGFGVAEFVNGSWTSYMDEQTNAFDNATDFFYIDDDGNRWLNHNIFLSKNQNGNIETTLISNTTLASNSISNLEKGEDGNMYFLASSKHISMRKPDGDWSLIPLPENIFVFIYNSDLLIISENDIWLGHDNGLYHYDGSVWNLNAIGDCYSLAKDSQGKIYVRHSNGIYIVDTDGTFIEYSLNDFPIEAPYISGLGIDPDDNLWVAVGEVNTIFKITPNGEWTIYSEANHPALDCYATGDFHFDVDGNVWVPSNCFGAFKFDGTTFSNPFAGFVTELENIDVYSVVSDENGKMYFSHQYGVTTLLDGEWEDWVVEEIPFNYSHESHARLDDEGVLWLGSRRYGLHSISTDATSSSSEIGEEEKLNFSIYPNPAKEFTVLEFMLEESSEIQIMMYDPIGELIWNNHLGVMSQGNFKERIPLHNLPAGFYVLQLRGNNQTTTKKIIVR